MNNLNMAGMNAMGGPVGGGGMPMMNNGIPGNARPVPVNDNQQRSQLNTYIYEYFLRNEMYECARAIINSDKPINVHKNSPGRRRDVNGVSPEGTDGDSKDDIDPKRPNDLPAPNLPTECPESCFLLEWWCLFWDMFNAQRGKGDSRSVTQYVAYTQQNSRLRQEQQQQLLRGIHRPDVNFPMGRNPQNGMNMGPNDIARKAMHNNGRNVTPQHMMQIQQQAQAQQQQQQHQKQQQMQRDGSDLDGSRRPQSPGSVENAPSPSKRPRIEGAPFNGQQGMPNGRGQPQGIPGQQQVGPANNTLQATQMLLNSGINPSLTAQQQFQQFQGQNQAGQTKAALQNYNTGLVQHQQSQMPNKGIPNPGGPQNQGSPMMTQGQDGGAISTYYNTADLGANGMRPGTGGQPNSSGNHALQDYQMQLMLLEQQNKKRLMMARQEQDNMGGMPRDVPGGPGGPGPNGQPFQGASPQGGRTGTSPNLNDPMKRGTPQLNAAGIPSPLPEGQSRGSPGAMNFMPGQMDPNLAPHFYKQMNGMDANMVATMQNRMQPPSSHPGAFNGPMNQQMMNMARQQQQQGGGQGWQAGPNGTPMMQQPSQGGLVPQAMGTPQQRAMPPPSAPAASAPANGRTQPSSPQQSAAPPTPLQANKAAPKGKKDSKLKRGSKKVATTSSATPATATADEPATPAPATPITPHHPQSFNKNGQNGGGQNTSNGQASAPAPVVVPPVALLQQDPSQNTFALDDNSMYQMEFVNPNMGTADVLQDFDFDSFLHQDAGENDAFAFDPASFLEGGEVGAE